MSIVDIIKLKVRRLMDAKGIKPYVLAEKADLAKSGIDKWYNKKNSEPSLSSLEKICQYFDITFAELCSREEDELVPATPEERELLEYWQGLDTSQRQGLLMYIRSSKKE